MFPLLQTATGVSAGVCQQVSSWRSELIFPHLLLPAAIFRQQQTVFHRCACCYAVWKSSLSQLFLLLLPLLLHSLSPHSAYLLSASGWLQGFSKSGFKMWSDFWTVWLWAKPSQAVAKKMYLFTASQHGSKLIAARASAWEEQLQKLTKWCELKHSAFIFMEGWLLSSILDLVFT